MSENLQISLHKRLIRTNSNQHFQGMAKREDAPFPLKVCFMLGFWLDDKKEHLYSRAFLYSAISIIWLKLLQEKSIPFCEENWSISQH